MDRALLIMMAVAFAAVGVGVGQFFVRRLVRAVRSKAWPAAVGELNSAELRKVVFNGVGRDSAQALVTDFSYRYTVGGKSYDGKRVTYSDHVNKTKGSLDALVRHFEGKKTVTVHYSPSAPAESVLVPGASIYNVTSLITPLLFLAAAYFMLTHDFT